LARGEPAKVQLEVRTFRAAVLAKAESEGKSLVRV
jgi:hypothetical protein